MKNRSNFTFESKTYSNDTIKNEEFKQTLIDNNFNNVQTKNNILNSIGDSIFEEGTSINNSIYNIFPLNGINDLFNYKKDNQTQSRNKRENILEEETCLKNKTFKFTIMKPGRKRKNEKMKSEHNKFSDDILRRKVKHLVLKNLMEFINEKIYYMYNGNIGHSIYIKKLLTINGNQNSNATIKFNQNFLKKKLGDIFSVNISTKYTNHDPDHNKKLIKKLKKEEDEKKRIYFIKFFNLTFLQGLRHYIGEEYIDELKGLKCFNEEKNTMNEEEEYIEILDKYIQNYEKNIMKKKERPKKETTKS